MSISISINNDDSDILIKAGEDTTFFFKCCLEAIINNLDIEIDIDENRDIDRKIKRKLKEEKQKRNKKNNF